MHRFMSWWTGLGRSKQRLLTIVLVALPALVLITGVAIFAVNVPFWDQWELVPLIQKVNHNTISFSDLFAQHNEHRILFPRLIMLGLAAVTHWNILFEVATNIILASATFTFVILMLRRTLTGKLFQAIIAIILSAIIFSPGQLENWLWGWQIQWFLNVLGLVVAVWALGVWRARPAYKVGVAVVAATVATFSLASGFFVWLVCLPLFWPKALRRLSIVWVLVGLVEVFVYYNGYQQPGDSSGLFFLTHLLQFVAYMFTYLALPLAFNARVVLGLGIIYVAAILATTWLCLKKFDQKWWLTLLPWLAVGAYGLLAAVSTAISRLDLGVSQAYSSRYQTVSCLILMMLVVVLAKMWESSSDKTRVMITSTLIVITILVSANFAKGILQMKDRHLVLLKAQQCAVQAKEQNDPCLTLLYPRPSVLWPRLEYLRQIHWGGL